MKHVSFFSFVMKRKKTKIEERKKKKRKIEEEKRDENKKCCSGEAKPEESKKTLEDYSFDLMFFFKDENFIKTVQLSVRSLPNVFTLFNIFDFTHFGKIKEEKSRLMKKHFALFEVCSGTLKH